MIRVSLIVGVLASVSSFGEEEPMRSEPLPSFAAEAVVQTVRLQPVEGDGVDWVEVSLRISRCIAGPCTVHTSVKVRIATDQWRGRHGDPFGVIRYEWKDKNRNARVWAMALQLDDFDQKERFERESMQAIANVGAPSDPVAAR
jgi:hypothetical protein